MVSTSHLYCAHCGAANPQHARFCTACGHQLPSSHSASDVALAVTPVQASFQTLAYNHMLKGRYKVIAKVGLGGFGSVYKAADMQFNGRAVAIKEMSQNELALHEVAEAAENFKREAFMLADLQHPNLPSIFDYFVEDGRWYLVMSFIEGETLEEYVHARGGRLSAEKVIHIGIQLCAVLNFLHNRKPPIIFRDLKPTNVMRTPERHLYLIDFGVARHFKPGKSKDTMALGSPGYAAPEQYGKAQTTPRTDIFSLGVLLHQLLTGDDPSQTPFSFKPLYTPDYPELAPLIMQMLEMDPNRRPTTMNEIRETLKRIAISRPPGGGRPGGGARGYSPGLGPRKAVNRPTPLPPTFLADSIPPDQMPGGQQWLDGRYGQQQMMMLPAAPAPFVAHRFRPRPRPRLSRRNMLAGAVGVAGIAIAGNLLVWLVDNHVSSGAQPDRLPLSAKVPATSQPAPLVDKVFDVGLLSALSWSSNNQQLACSTLDGRLLILPIAGGGLDIKSHTFTVGQITTLAWSPDGKSIAVALINGRVSLVEAQTGLILTSYNEFPKVGSEDALLLSLAWSPDGKSLAAGTYDGWAYVWEVASGQITARYETDVPVCVLAWSPGGQSLAMPWLNSRVAVIDARTQKAALMSPGNSGDVRSVTWSPGGNMLASVDEYNFVNVWESQSGAHIFTYQGHAGSVNMVAWSPRDNYVASGSDDMTVQVWNAMNGQLILTYNNHHAPVIFVAWSPDGTSIASGDRSGHVRVWVPE